jgi:hypothetical protein
VIVSWAIYIPLTFIFFVPWLFNAHLNFVSGVFSLFLITYFLRKKTESVKERIEKTLIIVLPIILFSIFYFVRGRSSWNTIPNYVIAPAIGLVLAILYERSTNFKFRLVTIFFGSLVCLWIVWRGFFIWGYWAGFGCLGTVYEKAPDFRFENKAKIITNKDLKGKVSVVYFWETVDDTIVFSNFNDTFCSWKNIPDLQFFTVNISTADSKINPIPLKVQTHRFNNYHWHTNSKNMEIFSQDSVPKVIIMNKRGRIVFRGKLTNINAVLNRALLE